MAQQGRFDPTDPNYLDSFLTGDLEQYVANASVTNVLTTDKGNPVTLTKSTNGYVKSNNGLLVNVPANVPTITPWGFITKLGGTQQILWTRDLSQVAWVKTNCTVVGGAAKGADGTANSASVVTLTSTSPATILQTPAAQTVCFFAWVRIIQGNPVVAITADSGYSYLNVSPICNRLVFTRVETLTDNVGAVKQVGFKITGNSGDLVAIDFCSAPSQAGTFGPYNPTQIVTTSAIAGEGSETISIPNPFTPNASFYASCDVQCADPWGSSAMGMSGAQQALIGSGPLFSDGPNTWFLGFGGNGNIKITMAGVNLIGPQAGVSGIMARGGSHNFAIQYDAPSLTVTGYVDGVVNITGSVPHGSNQSHPVNIGFVPDLAGTNLQYGVSNVVLSTGPIGRVNKVHNPWGVKHAFNIGDSITAGGSGSSIGGAHAYCQYINQLQGPLGYNYWNLGVSGTQVADMITQFPLKVAGQGGTRFTLFGGINDLLLGNVSAATLDTRMRTLIGLCLNEPACERVCIGTIVPGLNFTGGSNIAREPDRQSINTTIRTLYTSIDPRVLVCDPDALLHDPASPSNYLVDYDSGDHLHPNGPGHQIVGTLFANQLSGVIN
jgi:lysophospholipase L1-like esterase